MADLIQTRRCVKRFVATRQPLHKILHWTHCVGLAPGPYNAQSIFDPDIETQKQDSHV
jgi:hypothetical protein